MAALTDEQKVFVVVRLACYNSPASVIRGLREEYGVKVDRRAIQAYDASKPYNTRRMSKALRKLFEETRELFERDAIKVPIASKIYRLQAYQRAMERAEEMGNLVLVGEMCERAAKEVGNAYTNKREMSGPGGAPIPLALPAVIEVPEMAKDMQDWQLRFTPKALQSDERAESVA
jgi:hypothetical protein